MKHNERIILQCFNKMDVPQDYTSSFGRELFISTLIGYSEQLVKNGFIKTEAKEDFVVAEESFKNEAKNFVGLKIENLVYYNIVKSCLLIVNEYLNK